MFIPSFDKAKNILIDFKVVLLRMYIIDDCEN